MTGIVVLAFVSAVCSVLAVLDALINGGEGW